MTVQDATIEEDAPSSASVLDTPDDARRAATRNWLSRAVKPSTALMRKSALCGIGAGLCIILQCYLLALLLHRLVMDGASLTETAPLFIGLLASIFARAGLTILQDHFGIAAAHRIECLLRDRFTKHMQMCGPQWTRSFDAGALVTLATDQIAALEGYVARYLPQTMIAAVVPIAILIITFPINWVVGVLFLMAGPLAPFFMMLIGMGAASASARQHDAMARMGGHFLDRLRGLTTLKLFGQAQEECDAITHVAEGLRIRTMKVLRIAFLSSTVLEFFSMTAIAIIAIYVGMGLLGFMSIGPAADITLFNALFVLLLAPEFFQPLRHLATLYHDRAAAVGATDRLMDLIDLSAQPKPISSTKIKTAPRTAPAISFRNVSLEFDGGRTALRKIDFDLAAGESLALMGPSGAGKTSILRLLMGFGVPTNGTILVNGTPLTSFGAGGIRTAIAWSGQSPHLFHGTLSANVTLGDNAPDKERAINAARRAHVSDFADTLPRGLDTLIGERHFGLSGGEAQRLALARAFYHDAPLVLLDEPTASLDTENERLVLQSLKELLPGRTVILSTHSEEAARLCSRTLRVTGGCIDEGSEAS